MVLPLLLPIIASMAGSAMPAGIAAGISGAAATAMGSTAAATGIGSLVAAAAPQALMGGIMAAASGGDGKDIIGGALGAGALGAVGQSGGLKALLGGTAPSAAPAAAPQAVPQSGAMQAAMRAAAGGGGQPNQAVQGPPRQDQQPRPRPTEGGLGGGMMQQPMQMPPPVGGGEAPQIGFAPMVGAQEGIPNQAPPGMPQMGMDNMLNSLDPETQQRITGAMNARNPLSGSQFGSGFAHGGPVGHHSGGRFAGVFQEGGHVRGPGTGTSDDIPAQITQNGVPVQEARLSDNEFVMTEAAVEGAGGPEAMYAMQDEFEERYRQGGYV